MTIVDITPQQSVCLFLAEDGHAMVGCSIVLWHDGWVVKQSNRANLVWLQGTAATCTSQVGLTQTSCPDA